MKKILLLLLLPISVWAQDCTVNVHVNGVSTVYFNGDSTAVKNGIASIEVPTTKPFGSLRIKKFKGGIISPVDSKTVYLQPGVIDIALKDKDSVFFATVKGPKWTTDYDEKLRLPVDKYNLRTHQLGDAWQSAKKNNSADTTRLKTLQNESIYNCFQVPQIYVKANPNSPLCIIALNFLGAGAPEAKLNVADLEALFNTLPEETRNSTDGVAYAAKLERWKNMKKKP